MCFNKTAALLANKVSLWLQPDEQTSRLLAGIQLQLGTASLPASCLALSLSLSLSLSLTLSLSRSHNLGEIEAGRLFRSLLCACECVCVCDSLGLIHPPFIRHFPFSARGEGELLPKKLEPLRTSVLGLCMHNRHTPTHMQAHPHTHTHTHTHTHKYKHHTHAVHTTDYLFYK